MKPSDSDKDSPAKDEFEQVVENLKTANNILVTVSTDPTIDQFAACIGLTLILNKTGKHANAVFSGRVPSTIDFLKPEKTLEKDTNSLRDFIIALDKAKADKLRYKVEDDVVKIFITPYKTSISEKDLEFSEGDFNVDAIVALGVQDKNHIDEAILAHGRILHDATVISINIEKPSRLGSINWSDTRASSLCEMVADVAIELDSKIFDSQNATALLTGIVAETDRYSNNKAAPHTMSVAGLLMSAGASTQLVSTQLGDKPKIAAASGTDDEPTDHGEDGVLEIEHQAAEEQKDEDAQPVDIVEETEEEEDGIPPPPADLLTDEHIEPKAEAPPAEDKNPPTQSKSASKSKVMHEPPEFDSRLTANSEPEEDQYSGSTDPMSNLPDAPLLSRTGNKNKTSYNSSAKAKTLADIKDDQTLSDIEKAVDSPHIDEQSSVGSTTGASLGEARDAVLQAEAASDVETSRPEPLQSIGTTELGSNLNSDDTLPESAALDPKTNKDVPPPVPPPYTPDL